MVRVVTAQDWATWRDLRLQALGSDPGAFGSRLADWRDASEQRWRARLALPGSRNLVADLAGVPAGMASGVPAVAADTVDLTSMWVARAARGRGVGDALVDDVVAWARAQGADRVRLSVVVDNAAALALYRRHGFLRVLEPSDGPGEVALVLRLGR